MENKLKEGCCLDCDTEDGVPVLQTCLIDEGDSGGCNYAAAGKTKDNCGFWTKNNNVNVNRRNVFFIIRDLTTGSYFNDYMDISPVLVMEKLRKNYKMTGYNEDILNALSYEIVEVELVEVLK